MEGMLSSTQRQEVETGTGAQDVEMSDVRDESAATRQESRTVSKQTAPVMDDRQMETFVELFKRPIFRGMSPHRRSSMRAADLRDPQDQLLACFIIHRLGDPSRTGRGSTELVTQRRKSMGSQQSQ